MGIVTCPEDGKRYHQKPRCDNCNKSDCINKPLPALLLETEIVPDGLKKLLHNVGMTVEHFQKLLFGASMTIEKYLECFDRCPHCGEVIMPAEEPALREFDPELCGQTKPNEKCPFVGVRCRDIKLGDKTCLNLKPGPSWIDELIKQKATHKYMTHGKINYKKINHELKKRGISSTSSIPPEPLRHETSGERYSFLLQYIKTKKPRPNKRFCSENCRKAYFLKSI